MTEIEIKDHAIKGRDRDLKQLDTELREARAEIERLREWADKEDHAADCDTNRRVWSHSLNEYTWPKPCDCWKARIAAIDGAREGMA